MTMHTRWTIYALRLLSACFLPSCHCRLGRHDGTCAGLVRAVPIIMLKPLTVSRPRRTTPNRSRRRTARKKAASPSAAVERPATPAARLRSPPPKTRSPTIPGMPDARFWADSTTDFINALPAQPGPWLVLSSGGGDGAFGAGLLVGLSAAGNRPEYSVVTGVSTGALMAPFVFAGKRYDDSLAQQLHQGQRGRRIRGGPKLRKLRRFVAAQGYHRQAGHAGPARRCRGRTSSRSPFVHCDFRSRRRTPRHLEHGRDRRSRRTGCARAVSNRAARFDRCSGSVPAGVD